MMIFLAIFGILAYMVIAIIVSICVAFDNSFTDSFPLVISAGIFWPISVLFYFIASWFR